MKKLLLTLALLAGPASVYGYKDADLEKLQTTNECKYCDLTGAKLIEANLPWADLTKAKLDRADLRRAWLEGAILSGAILTKAKLEGTVLTGTVLTGAKLEGADLTEATFDGATTFENADLKGTKISKKALKADTTKDAGGKTLYNRLSLKQKNDYKNID